MNRRLVSVFGVWLTSSLIIVSAFLIVNRLWERESQIRQSSGVKELLGENDNYAVYLIDVTFVTPYEKGGILVYDKKNKTEIKIKGNFSIFGATIVINDQTRKYILLSTGTYTSRTIIPLSLLDKKLAGKEFCASSGKFVFYKEHVIYDNCDTFPNRPWGVGEAPSVVSLNLKTGQERIIAKSDLTHQYGGDNKIIGDNLDYLETFVANGEDWKDSVKPKSISRIFNLSSL